MKSAILFKAKFRIFWSFFGLISNILVLYIKFYITDLILKKIISKLHAALNNQNLIHKQTDIHK